MILFTIKSYIYVFISAYNIFEFFVQLKTEKIILVRIQHIRERN